MHAADDLEPRDVLLLLILLAVFAASAIGLVWLIMWLILRALG